MHFAVIAAALSACIFAAPEETGTNSSKITTFAPGIVSTEDLEYSITFTPDCRTIFFSRRTGDWGHSNNSEPVILESHWREGGWSKPVPVPFSGEYGDDDPFVTPDGEYLYFVSDRPKTQGAEKGDDYDIWRTRRTNDAWGELERLPEPVNSSGAEYSPALGASGAIYFASDRAGGFGQGDIYAGHVDQNGDYEVEHLPIAINSPLGEWNVGVNKKETILIFEASQRPQNLSSYGDLYVSYRDRAGRPWSPGISLSKLNTTGSNLMPRFTPDETHLFYGNTDTRESRDANIKYIRTEDILNTAEASEFIGVANRSEHVIALVDPSTYKVVAKIDSGKGPHEVASIAKGFITASYGVYNDVSDAMETPRRLKFKFDPSNGVVRYDLAANRQTAFSLEKCVRPHGVASSPDGSRFWVTCEEELAVAEINAVNGEELARWSTQQAGSHIVIYDDKRDRLYVANVDAGSVTLINRKTAKAKVLKTGDGAEGLALANDGDRLWVTNTQANTISVIDLVEDEVVRTFKSGGRFPVKPRPTPDGEEMWITQNNSNELSIFNVETMRMTKTISLESAPLGLLISPSGDRVFVTLPRLDRIDVFNASTKEKITSFSTGVEPDGMTWVTID